MEHQQFAEERVKRHRSYQPRLTLGNSSSVQPIEIKFPRPVSAIIDVDILPETLRRVRLHKHGSDKPLGTFKLLFLC